MRIQDVEFRDLLTLESHGPDTFVGPAVSYPWGSRLFGGQVIAQALRAAAATVDAERGVHSLHAYFIRPGTHDEPIRFEVERLRDGRSFSTRQVVARQSSGAILNLSLSFQLPEDEADIAPRELPAGLPDPDDPRLVDDGWGHLLERRSPPADLGHRGHWIRLDRPVGHSGDPPQECRILEVCALAFLSDSAPSRTARVLHPELSGDRSDFGRFQGASLDHAMWFHRPSRADEWHWFEMTPHGMSGGRSIVTGDVWNADGRHIATLAQQVLLRMRRAR